MLRAFLREQFPLISNILIKIKKEEEEKKQTYVLIKLPTLDKNKKTRQYRRNIYLTVFQNFLIHYNRFYRSFEKP